MITSWRYDNTGDREFIRRAVIANNYSVIDIGGGCRGVFRDIVKAIVDINDYNIPGVKLYQGNINYPEVWEKITAGDGRPDCPGFSKYDYAICSMTLEDICNPIFVANQISKIAKRGVIVPSKYRELTRNIHGPFRGFIHHHSIFDIVGGYIIRYAKLNLIEQERYNPPVEKQDLTELVIEWEGEIPIREVNDGFYGPDHFSVQNYYDNLLTH